MTTRSLPEVPLLNFSQREHSLSTRPGWRGFVASRAKGMLLCTLAGYLFSPAGAARAQNASGDVAVQPQTAGDPVTGRVVCADTQRAARFANVTLISATADEEGGGRGGRASARTDLDGNFLIPDVAPGDYYVTAQLTGYINEAPFIQAALQNSAGTPSAPAISVNVPKIRVVAGGASAQLSLQRGGVIAGTVQWDDGSPAAGVSVSTVAPPAAGQGTSPAAGTGFYAGPGPFGGGFSGGQTDDRGHFRLSGIAPGSYVVRAGVQAPAPAITADRRSFARNLTLNVYAPDKLRRIDAAVVTLTPGEERSDLTITMNLNALHTVSGTFSSTAAAVRSGSVTLTDSADSSLNRTGTVNPDGSFVVPYVPAGNYTLHASVSPVAQIFGRGGQTSSTAPSAVHFQPLQESLTVADGDLTGLSLSVTAAAATTTQ